MSKHLVLGGARSGKSRYAESLAKELGLPVTYLATATIYDDEMQARVEKHQTDRPASWQTLEVPFALGKAIRANRSEEHVVLVDCLTLWLMNILDQGQLERSVDELLLTLSETSGPIIMVSNEITMGVVPMGELSRRFVDELGRLHQSIAAVSEHVTLVVAGIPVSIKS